MSNKNNWTEKDSEPTPEEIKGMRELEARFPIYGRVDKSIPLTEAQETAQAKQYSQLMSTYSHLSYLYTQVQEYLGQDLEASDKDTLALIMNERVDSIDTQALDTLLNAPTPEEREELDGMMARIDTQVTQSKKLAQWKPQGRTWPYALLGAIVTAALISGGYYAGKEKAQRDYKPTVEYRQVQE